MEIIYKMVNILLQPRTNAVKTYVKCKVDQVFHHRLVHIQARQNMLHMIEHVRQVYCCLHTHEPHDLGVCSFVRIKMSGTAVLVIFTKTVDEGFAGLEGPFVEDEVVKRRSVT